MQGSKSQALGPWTSEVQQVGLEQMRGLESVVLYPGGILVISTQVLPWTQGTRL